MADSLSILRGRVNDQDQVLLNRLNDVTAQLAHLVLNGPQRLSAAEHQRRVKALEEQRESLESDVSRLTAGFYERPQRISMSTIREAIPDHAALIEFAVYRPFDPKVIAGFRTRDPHYVAYIFHKHGDVQWKELGPARPIDEAIAALLGALRSPKRGDVETIARSVYEKVMRPLRPLAGEATQLLISPDGSLNLIPFEALVDEQGKYLIERYSFNYLTSGRDLLRMQVAREKGTEPVVLADPAFGEPELAISHLAVNARRAGAHGRKPQVVRDTNDLSHVYFPSLVGTAQEARAIKALFPEATLLMGSLATESALKRVNAPRILHVATHGFFLRDPGDGATRDGDTEDTRAISATAKVQNPLLRSGLALAGANVNKGSNDDGILTALEASGLNLWGTKLVTLSACDTGVGEVKNGEGVYGLRRAFVLAGTETLVMSLWPVSDSVTRELMTAYYEGLKRGLGRGEALRQVQLRMLKHRDRQHPFYWASFIQSGEWANLEGKR